MLGIPLAAIPAQSLNVTLNGQACILKVYQKFWGLFIDVLVNNAVIIQGVLCENNNLIVRSLYLGFVGDLKFIDTQGNSNPDYTGLGPVFGSRFQLRYLFPNELPVNYGENPFDPNAIVDGWFAAFPNAKINPSSG